jgi:hypothetical protein
MNRLRPNDCGEFNLQLLTSEAYSRLAAGLDGDYQSKSKYKYESHNLLLRPHPPGLCQTISAAVIHHEGSILLELQ